MSLHFPDPPPAPPPSSPLFPAFKKKKNQARWPLDQQHAPLPYPCIVTYADSP